MQDHNSVRPICVQSQWGQDFTHPSRPSLRLTQAPVQWVLVLFSRVKAAGA